MMIIVSGLLPVTVIAQEVTNPATVADTLKVQSDSLVFSIPDSLLLPADTTKQSDTTLKKKSAISSKVEYNSTDSICLDMSKQMVFLYRDAEIRYEKITQKAAYIEINFNTSILKALPRSDSTGKSFGKPEFTEGEQSFRSEEMQYNFKTRKGMIKNVITQEGEGYLHGEVVKKMENNVSNMRHGGYTTCNLDHPHFSIKFTKAKVIPDNKIVTGPAYMSIEGVPLPLVLPFGLFPNKKGQMSGIVIPTYGESANRGFYLENGGYYFGINDYMELRLVGDIYSRGSWALKPLFNYKKRYKFSGTFNFNYSINIEGIKESPSYLRKRDFRLAWTHRQDPKARPKSLFNASVNFGSSTFNKYNPVTTQDHLTNTFGSSVSYSTNFKNRVNLSVALRHSQNTTNKSLNLTLPEISLSTNRFNPFRKPGKASDLKWYDNISVNYSMSARNEVNIHESTLFKPEMWDSLQNGMQHKIPVSSSVKLMKFFTWTNSVDYTERWYSKSIIKHWINDSLFTGNDTIVGYIDTDTISGFKAGRDFSFSSSLNTTLYGMLQFKKGPVRAIRHVIRPSVSFSLRPDFGRSEFGYYKEVQKDTLGNTQRYSIFSDGRYTSLFGSPPDGKSGRVGLSLSNNLEMKVRSKSDTITGMKKVMLIESFSISTSYDLARDSLRWSPVSISARTTLFKKLQVQYSASFDPYIQDSLGRAINKYEWDVNHRLLRRDNTSWNFSLAWNFGSGKNIAAKKDSPTATPDQLQEIATNPQGYIDWNNPWNLNFTYNLRYTGILNPLDESVKRELVQTLGFNGDINITPKWKFNLTSGYDFESNKLSYTSVNIYRDLHCWEMRFNWIPTGYLKSWNFYIKVKASVLQDLKLNRKKDFRDN
ncbi:MAG: putative LPS assembly protein LptD [Bacteroidota bacterium]